MLHLGRTVRLVWSISPGWTAANIVLAVVQGLLPLATLYMTKLITNAVVRGVDAPDKTAASRHVALPHRWSPAWLGSCRPPWPGR